MTPAQLYIEMVVSSSDPYSYVGQWDPAFKALTETEKKIVVAAFDGYGLRDLIAQRKSEKA